MHWGVMTGGRGEQGRGRRSERHVSSATTTMARREAPSGVSIHNEVIIAVNNSDHLNGDATKQCYHMEYFTKKKKERKC